MKDKTDLVISCGCTLIMGVVMIGVLILSFANSI